MAPSLEREGPQSDRGNEKTFPLQPGNSRTNYSAGGGRKEITKTPSKMLEERLQNDQWLQAQKIQRYSDELTERGPFMPNLSKQVA